MVDETEAVAEEEEARMAPVLPREDRERLTFQAAEDVLLAVSWTDRIPSQSLQGHKHQMPSSERMDAAGSRDVA